MEEREKEIRKECTDYEWALLIPKEDTKYLLSIIDSLRVDVEGLRKEKEILNVCALPEVLKLRTEVEGLRKERNLAISEISKISRELGLQDSRLSDLLTAAEPIKEATDRQYTDFSNFISISKLEAKVLSAAVDRAREGK